MTPTPPASSTSVLEDAVAPDSFADLFRQIARAEPVCPDSLEDASARRDLVGRTVGPFQVVERLGAGGMGVVYGAHDAWLGRRVALKVLAARFPRAEAGAVRREVRLLLREARAAAAISHPNVAAIYAAGEADGVAYIAMEYVKGVTLRSRLAREAMPVDEALRYGRQIAEGLAKAHERGVVHGDLKPDNVMIDGDDRIKILDFGLARPAPDPEAEAGDPPSQRAGAAGTPGYMAPEQARGERVDARSDVFSLGAVLYEMLAGMPAFGSRDGERSSWSFVPTRDLAEICADVPAGIRAVVARCMEVEAGRRYASARDVLQWMDTMAAGTAE